MLMFQLEEFSGQKNPNRMTADSEEAIRVARDASGKVLDFNQLLELCLKEEQSNGNFTPLKPRSVQTPSRCPTPATPPVAYPEIATTTANASKIPPEVDHSKYTIGNDSLMDSSFLSSASSSMESLPALPVTGNLVNTGVQSANSISDSESDDEDQRRQQQQLFQAERSRFRRQSARWQSETQSELDAFAELEQTLAITAVPTKFPASRTADVTQTTTVEAAVEFSQDFSWKQNEDDDFTMATAAAANQLMRSDYLNMTTAGFDYSQLSMESSILSNQQQEKEMQAAAAANNLPLDKNDDFLQRLFPGLRPAGENDQRSVRNKKPPSKKELMQQLREKQEALDRELAECRQLKDNLRKLKHEQDSATRRLQLDRERFEQHREQEQQRILQQSEEEMKKIRKERRLMEQHLRASQAIPSRKERQEIEELRQRLASVEESLRLKEAKWQLNEERLRRRVEELHQTNGDLREEIRLLEQERISRLRPPSAVDNPPVHDGKRSPLLLKREPVASSDKMTAVVENISALSLTRKPTASKLKPPSANTLSQSSKRTALANKSASQASTLTQENRPKPAVPPKPSPTVSTIKKPPSINISSATANIQLPSVKEQTQREDGTIVTRYPNGNVKETSTNGHIVVRLYNGDVKHVFPDKSWVYYFVDTMITQTTQADGVVIFDFPDGQVEKRLPDGQVEILYPDQTVRYIFGSGEEETVFADGTISRTDLSGRRVVEYADGSREVYWDDMKQRFELDGTVRTVFPDGTQETRYPNGHVRVLDHEGRLINV